MSDTLVTLCNECECAIIGVNNYCPLCGRGIGRHCDDYPYKLFDVSESNITCKDCGKAVPSDANYCPTCGKEANRRYPFGSSEFDDDSSMRELYAPPQFFGRDSKD